MRDLPEDQNHARFSPAASAFGVLARFSANAGALGFLTGSAQLPVRWCELPGEGTLVFVSRFSTAAGAFGGRLSDQRRCRGVGVLGPFSTAAGALVGLV